MFAKPHVSPPLHAPKGFPFETLPYFTGGTRYVFIAPSFTFTHNDITQRAVTAKQQITSFWLAVRC